MVGLDFVNNVHNIVSVVHSLSDARTLGTMDPSELIGLHEIATWTGVGRSAVANWRSRHSDFPAPVAEMAAGPVFNRSQIRKWLRARKKASVTTTIAFINMKGGVAKSTTTVATAQILAGDLGKNVLLIDLDPQTNATVMLIGDARWKNLNDDGHTVAQIFRAALNPRKESYDLAAIIQRRVGSVTDVRTLSLLPSSLDLITLQEELVNLPAGAFHAARPIDILYRALQQTINANEYDYILIDCPPSLGLVTLNGLRFAHGYVIPTVTDVLSTYGIPQIIQRVSDFAGELSEVIEPYGILATKFQVQSTVQKNQLALLRQTSEVPVFETIIPQANEIAAGAEFQQVNTLRQKWGGPKGYRFYREFVDELVERISSEVNA